MLFTICYSKLDFSHWIAFAFCNIMNTMIKEIIIIYSVVDFICNIFTDAMK
jgi:hypothetical protein